MEGEYSLYYDAHVKDKMINWITNYCFGKAYSFNVAIIASMELKSIFSPLVKF